MLELPHTLIGAAIATALPHPAVSLPLALASHFLADYVPHWNPRLFTELTTSGAISSRSRAIVVADSVSALVGGLLIASRSLPDVGRFLIVLAACFLAVAPDVVEIPFFFLNFRPAWISAWVQWQRRHQWNVAPAWGLLSQLLVSVAALYLILAT